MIFRASASDVYGRMRKLPGRNVGGEEGSRERKNTADVVSTLWNVNVDKYFNSLKMLIYYLYCDTKITPV